MEGLFSLIAILWVVGGIYLIYAVFIKPFADDAKLREEYRNSPFTDYPMNGHDFEHWVAEKLRAMGWDAKVTTASGDQGIDILALKNGYQFGIQCKRMAKPCSNRAVQEVLAGGRFYGVTNLAVISTSGFTKSAIDLADRGGVFLFTNMDLHKLDALSKD